MRALLGLALVACACGSGDRGDRGEGAGEALARGLAAVANNAELAPLPCARAALGGAADSDFEAGGRAWTVRGDELRAADGDRELVVGVIADARSHHDDTAANLAAARQAFADAGVELVLVLGGMAGDRAGLDAVIGALQSEAWPLVAMPGDLEPVAALAETLAAAGDRAIDGARVRAIHADGAVIATLPGGVHRDRLPAGDGGCVATGDDAGAVAERLRAAKATRVVASYVPPRQSGPGASDRTMDGVHVGDPAVATGLGDDPVLVLSAMVEDAAAGAASGEAPLTARTFLAAGAIDASALTEPGSGLVVRIGAKRVRWRRLRFRRGKLRNR